MSSSTNDNNVKIFFKYNGKIVQLPVNPEELRIVSQGNNQAQEVVTLGEVNILKDRKLSEVSIESFFPISEAPSYVLTSGKDFLSPQELIDFFSEPFKNKKPLYMVISGIAGSSVGWDKTTRGSSNNKLSWNKLTSTLKNKVNSLVSSGASKIYDSVPKISITTTHIEYRVSIEAFETWYQSDFDTNYKLELKEFKNYGAVEYKEIISVDENTGIANVTISAPARHVEEADVLVKNLKIANRAVRTVNRVAGIARKAVNTIKSTGQFIKTVSKKI